MMGNSISWANHSTDGQEILGKAIKGPVTSVSAIHGASTVEVHGGAFTVAGRDSHTTNYTTFYSIPSEASRDDSRRLQILDWVSGINYRTYQRDTLKKRAPGTGRWVFETNAFVRWLRTKGSILWATGIPGAGKTILASIIIEYLEEFAAKSRDVSLVFAYCRYTDTLSVAEILAALVRQQLERHPFLFAIIEPFYAHHIREKTRPSEAELLNLLKEFSGHFTLNLYYIDGLDEAKYDTQFDLVEAMSSFRDANFMLTSRPLNMLESKVPDAVFFQILAHESDLILMISSAINRHPTFRKVLERHNMQQEVVAAIVERSNGMFLHAALQIDMLRHCLSIREIRRKLDRFPAEVNDLYATALGRIEGQSEEHADLAKSALLWLAHAQRTLTVDELLYAVATCPETYVYEEDRLVDEDTLASVCCGLVTIEHESRIIRLVHYTAKDSLPGLLSKFFSDPHTIMAQTCIKRLTSCSFQNLTLESERLLLATFARNPLLRYAYESWADHVNRARETHSLHQAVLQFLVRCESFPCKILEFPDVVHDYYLDLVLLNHIETPLQVAAFYNLPQYLDELLMHDISDSTSSNKVHKSRLGGIPDFQMWNRHSSLALAITRGHEVVAERLLINNRESGWHLLDDIFSIMFRHGSQVVL